MLPVTRANLDHICCICLSDIRPSVFTRTVYDVKKENNMTKMLKLSAHITILKNPMNQKFINDYCRKVCEICYVKVQFTYGFRQRIIASIASLKELIESGELNELDIERLQHFCRICLNRQDNEMNNLKMEHLMWLKNCSGVRFTSLADNETFRLKEGTNINEIAVVDDQHFPRQLCKVCIKKLQNVEGFRQSATQSFEYMISLMGDISVPEDDLVMQRLKKVKDNVGINELQQPQLVFLSENPTKLETISLQTKDNNVDENEQEDNLSSIVMEVEESNDNSTIVDPIDNSVNTPEATKQEDDNSINATDFVQVLPPHSDEELEEDDDNVFGDVDFALDTSNDEISSVDCNENDVDYVKNICSRKTRAKHYVKKPNDDSETVKEEIKKTKKKSATVVKQKATKKDATSKKSKKVGPSQRNLKQPKENSSTETTNKTDSIENDKFICNECSKEFSGKVALRKHMKNVHTPEALQTWYTCPICSKRFKRKKHLDEHIQAVHEKLRPYKCSHCESVFSTNGSKKAHELTHTDIYPFVCKFCQKGFRRSYQLKVHLELHTTSPELLCPICKRGQKSSEELAEHIKSHEDKRLQCPWCGKLFTRGSHLTEHQNAVHLKLRPFKCEFCDQAFGDRKARQYHQKSHTEERPLSCSICKRGFKSRNVFNRHINVTGHISEENDAISKKTKKKRVTSELPSQHYTSAPFNSIFEI